MKYQYTSINTNWANVVVQPLLRRGKLGRGPRALREQRTFTASVGGLPGVGVSGGPVQGSQAKPKFVEQFSDTMTTIMARRGVAMPEGVVCG
jgi:hypothetical protein